MDLIGKRIVVTGGAQGIGAAAVRAFVAAGASVAVMDMKLEACRAVAAKASEAGGGSATAAALDITDRADVDRAFAKASDDMGGLDVLVNAAGVQMFAPVADVEASAYARIFTVNVLRTMNTNGAAFNIMRRAGAGNIINFGSEAGLTASLDNAVYGASKGAVHTWTRSVARDWGLHGVRVNAVLPYVVTPMYLEYRRNLSEEKLRAHDEAMLSAIPLGGKFGDPDVDLAPFLMFLAGDGSRYMTGQLFPVDGGLIAVR